ncbi:hypothetical protein GCM10020219_099420 [Nonomuraea dietziae]
MSPHGGHPGGVQDAVQRAEAVQGRLHGAAHVRGPCRVAGDDLDLGAQLDQSCDLGHAPPGRLRGRLPAVQDGGPLRAGRQAVPGQQHEPGTALARQMLGQAEGDAAEPAGDQIHAAVPQRLRGGGDGHRVVAGQPAPAAAQRHRAVAMRTGQLGGQRVQVRGGRLARQVDEAGGHTRVLQRDHQAGAGQCGTGGVGHLLAQHLLGAGDGHVERPAADARLAGGAGERDERVQAAGDGEVVRPRLQRPQVDDPLQGAAGGAQVAQQGERVGDAARPDGVAVGGDGVGVARPYQGDGGTGGAQPPRGLVGEAVAGEDQPGAGLPRGGRGGRGLPPHGQVEPLVLGQLGQAGDGLEQVLGLGCGLRAAGGRVDPVALSLEGVGGQRDAAGQPAGGGRPGPCRGRRPSRG